MVQQSNGEIGYDNTSSIIAKINVEDLDTSILSFLNELNPVTYNYRKKDEYGKFTNEPEEQDVDLLQRMFVICVKNMG